MPRGQRHPDRLETVFDKHSHLYDYVALAQEFIPTAHEYRLVCYKQTPVLAYARSGGPSTFNARYWEGASARAVLIEQAALLDELAAFVRPVYGVLDLGFVGFDIVRAVDGRLYLLELNSGPRFDRVIATNGQSRSSTCTRPCYRPGCLKNRPFN